MSLHVRRRIVGVQFEYRWKHRSAVFLAHGKLQREHIVSDHCLFRSRQSILVILVWHCCISKRSPCPRTAIASLTAAVYDLPLLLVHERSLLGVSWRQSDSNVAIPISSVTLKEPYKATKGLIKPLGGP